MIKIPPGNSFINIVLPLSRERGLFIFSRSAGQFSIAGSIRILDVRLAVSVVGFTISIGPGALQMQKPIQLFPHSVPPTCAPFMNTTLSQGWLGDRQSIISFKYGVLSVFHLPGSLLDTLDKNLCLSAHSVTV